jgi:hypothetical protein
VSESQSPMHRSQIGERKPPRRRQVHAAPQLPPLARFHVFASNKTIVLFNVIGLR